MSEENPERKRLTGGGRKGGSSTAAKRSIHKLLDEFIMEQQNRLKTEVSECAYASKTEPGTSVSLLPTICLTCQLCPSDDPFQICLNSFTERLPKMRFTNRKRLEDHVRVRHMSIRNPVDGTVMDIQELFTNREKQLMDTLIACFPEISVLSDKMKLRQIRMSANKVRRKNGTGSRQLLSQLIVNTSKCKAGFSAVNVEGMPELEQISSDSFLGAEEDDEESPSTYGSDIDYWSSLPTQAPPPILAFDGLRRSLVGRRTGAKARSLGLRFSTAESVIKRELTNRDVTAGVSGTEEAGSTSAAGIEEEFEEEGDGEAENGFDSMDDVDVEEQEEEEIAAYIGQTVSS